MRRPMMTAILVALVFGRLTPALADVALGKAADNAIYAQRLVNETVASHPAAEVAELTYVNFSKVRAKCERS